MIRDLAALDTTIRVRFEPHLNRIEISMRACADESSPRVVTRYISCNTTDEQFVEELRRFTCES